MSSFWMDGTWNSGNLRFWKNVRVHFSSSRIKKLFWTCPPLVLQIPVKKWDLENQATPKIQSPLSATLMFFWHKWEDESRKVNMNAVNLSPTPWNFCPIMIQALWKSWFLTSIPRGQNPRFPDAAGAGQILNSRSRHPQRTQWWNTSAREPSLLT